MDAHPHAEPHGSTPDPIGLRVAGAPLPSPGRIAFGGVPAAPVMEQAAFFALAIRLLPPEPRGLSWRLARCWAEDLSEDVPNSPAWLEALGGAQDAEGALSALSGALSPDALAAGVPVVAAFLRRRWCLGRLSREQVREVLMDLSAEATGGLAHTLAGPTRLALSEGAAESDERLDKALIELFQGFEEYDRLIPRGVW